METQIRFRKLRILGNTFSEDNLFKNMSCVSKHFQGKEITYLDTMFSEQKQTLWKIKKSENKRKVFQNYKIRIENIRKMSEKQKYKLWETTLRAISTFPKKRRKVLEIRGFSKMVHISDRFRKK